MRNESDRDRVVRQGRQALKMLNTDQNFTWWLDVGDAILIGREEAMREAGTNQPQGGLYNRLFGEWLVREKLDFDKGDRSRLLQVMDNRLAIEEWRSTLTLVERRRLNHPSTVLRKWKASKKIGKPGERRTNSNAANAILRRELDDAKALIAELEAARGGSTKVKLTVEAAREAITAALGKMNHGKRHAAMHDLAGYFMKQFPDLDIKVYGNIGSIQIGSIQTGGQPATKARPQKKAKADGKPALKWKLTSKDMHAGDGYASYEANTAAGRYSVDPAYLMEPGKKFDGYTVAYSPRGKRQKGTMMGGMFWTTGTNTIAHRIKTADEAKAIAQADHERGGTAS